MTEEGLRNRMIGRVTALLARYGAADIHALGDDPWPRPRPVPGRDVIVLPDVTAIFPDLEARGRRTMAMSLDAVRGGARAFSSSAASEGGLYIAVRVETRERLEDPKRLDCWNALARHVAKYGGQLWLALDPELRAEVEAAFAQADAREAYILTV